VAELTPPFFVICALLVVAGGHKILAPDGATKSLALLGVRAPRIAVRALGVGEVVVGVVAVVRPGVVTTTLLAVVYGTFGGFVVLLLVRNPGAGVDCGCFGDDEHSAGWLHVALNAVACAVAAASAVLGAHGVTWILSRPPLIAPSLIVGMLAASYAAYLAYTLVPSAWASYGSGATR
jgi:hypothetical protein